MSVEITANVTSEQTFTVYDVKAVNKVEIRLKESLINFEAFNEYLDDSDEKIDELGMPKTERQMVLNDYPAAVKAAILTLKDYAETIGKEDIGLT